MTKRNSFYLEYERRNHPLQSYSFYKKITEAGRENYKLRIELSHDREEHIRQFEWVLDNATEEFYMTYDSLYPEGHPKWQTNVPQWRVYLQDADYMYYTMVMIPPDK